MSYKPGDHPGTLDEVKRNVSRYGALEVCEFVQGWFDDTLPLLNERVALAFVDVDLESSLTTCMRNLWPNPCHSASSTSARTRKRAIIRGITRPLLPIRA